MNVLLKMVTIRISLLWLLLCQIVSGVVLTIPVTVSPIGGSQSFRLTDNSGASISLSGQTLCTHDIPVSGCISSTIVRGSDDVEFLLSESGSAQKLSFGDILSDQPAIGSWGANFLNRYEFLASRQSPREGTFSPVNEEFVVGFRIRDSEEGFRYGWLEAKPDVAGFGTSFDLLVFDDSVTNSLVISPVPEPSSVFLTAIAILLINGGRHRTQPMSRA